MASNDLFAPITQEEMGRLKDLASSEKTVFAPPSKAELSSLQRPSEIDSAARGLAQGATLGFADEISGGAEALWNKAKGDPTEFGKLYQQYRDESRSNFKKAQESNPGSYMAGEIGGGIATAAIPFGGAATLGRAVVSGARAGALAGLGMSEAKDAAGLIEDTAKGVAMGAVGGVIGKGAEKAIGGAKGYLANRAASVAGSADEVASVAKQAAPGDWDSVNEVRKSAVQRIKSYFNPQVDPKWDEFKAIAEKNGINPSILPESVQFGPDSSASRASRSLAEGRFGEETLKRFNQSLGEVRNAYNTKIANYSKGLPTDEVTAGKILRDSYDEGVSKFFDQMDFTHNSIIDQVPGLQLTPKALERIESSLSGIEKFAKGRMERGVTGTQRGQGQQLLNAVEAIRSGNGSYKQTVEALRDIGEAAFQSKNSLADVPVDVAKMRKIYNDLNGGLIDTVRSQLGDDIADSLVANNKAMSEFFGDQSLLARVMGDKAIAPEQAFRSLVLSGDSQRLQALKKVIPADKWEYLKGATLENLAKRDAEGDFTFKQLYNSMRSKKSALSSLFEPEELADTVGLVRLGDRFGPPVLSNSGTGASISFQDLYKVPLNIGVDSIGVRNARAAARGAANPPLPKRTPIQVPQKIRDVTPRIAGALAASPSSLERQPPRSDIIDRESKPKGPDKWARDGVNRLIESGVSKEDAEALLNSKEGKELLFEASGSKKDSVRMRSILKRLKSASLQGGE